MANALSHPHHLFDFRNSGSVTESRHGYGPEAFGRMELLSVGAGKLLYYNYYDIGQLVVFDDRYCTYFNSSVRSWPGITPCQYSLLHF